MGVEPLSTQFGGSLKNLPVVASLHRDATELAEQGLLPQPVWKLIPTDGTEGNSDSSEAVSKASSSDLRTRVSRGDRSELSQCFRRIMAASSPSSEQNSSFGPLISKATCLAHHESWVPLCGVDHRQHEHRRATTQSSRMNACPDPDNDRKSDLECLRLASELIELATETLNPALKAHCLRMAAYGPTG